MTLSLSRALAPEVRVNAVCPGFVGTRWFKDRFGDETYGRMIENQKATTPLKRAGTPDDIADSVVFFCAEGAEHITGETLIVDAGLHLSLTPLSQR
jgi:3-oxoacyl-[acyl-carrier protein] reductase